MPAALAVALNVSSAGLNRVRHRRVYHAAIVFEEIAGELCLTTAIGGSAHA